MLQTHYDKLQDEGKSLRISDIAYDNTPNEPLNYEEGSRSLTETDTLNDDDVIDIPSETFEAVVRTSLDFEGDIISVAGIEYFESVETLVLRYQPNRTSINGVQALDALETLYLTKSAVKTIDYAFRSLKELIAPETSIDLTAEAFSDLVKNAPNLEVLSLQPTPTTVKRRR